MLFDNWTGLLHVLITGVLAYFALIISLRISGKRTLSKWNAFDFVMTIALGSILASVILIEDVALLEGIIAFGVLMGLQFVITWLSVRFKFVRRLIKSEPTLLLSDGKFIMDSLESQRVTQSEVRAAVRRAGSAALEDVKAVVLETDGSFSVIKNAGNGPNSALQDVDFPP